jgi:hypothetical protein
VQGFLVGETLLKELAAAPDRAEFQKRLQAGGTPVKPEFNHPGFVMAVTISFLEEHGVSMPLSDRHPDVRKILHSDVNLLSCMDPESAALFAEFVAGMQLSDGELGRYYREFSEETFPGAPDAMRDAIRYLQAGAKLVSAPDQKLLVLMF